jgi:hypothetical protein
MPKTNKRVKRHSTKKKHSTRRYRKHRTIKGTSLFKIPKGLRSDKAKGPTSDNVKCCMCGKEIDKMNGLIPGQCLRTYGAIRGHRICKECWFSKFAKEGVNHSCPGCVKGLPLNGPVHDPSVIVDLTED